MTLSEFIRLYPLRAKSIAWFFGAGTSVSGGLPTAWDLVWEFKKRIYCSEEGYSLSLFKNLSDPAIRKQIQSYFDGRGDCPVEDSVEEYSFYFEMAYPAARDRSEYLAQQLKGMQNSYGHKVIGVLMKNGLLPLTFTTNFDKAFENAAVEQLRTMDRFFVATMDNTDASLQQYHGGMRPYIAKIHGDYFSEKLKNTTEELKSQDAKLRDILYHASLSNGLAVMGYSGRDDSVMEVFHKALDQSSSFPNGIFWFTRQGSKPLKQVQEFIEKAKSKGIQAEYVEIETFDTAWADIIKGIPHIPADDLAQLNQNYFKRSATQIPAKGSNSPIVRFNAIKVSELPANCRIIKCNAGNTKEVRALITNQKAELLAIRKKIGVVGFGSDAEFDRVFGTGADITKDVFQIHESVFHYEDSVIKGLITDALIRALVRGRPLKYIKRGQRYLIIIDPRLISDPALTSLKNELNFQIEGQIPNSTLRWVAALEVQLQKKFSEHLLLLNPTILASRTDVIAEKRKIAPFVKEATARWYNSKYPKILDAWLNVLFTENKELSVSTFGNGQPGFDAHFKLIRESAFTKTR
ncbi:MAG: SIR2 family protein [Bacteroidia bacterium]